MRYISRLVSVLIFSLTASFFGCQEESQEVITPLPTDTISKESISGLSLNRISQQDGSDDNIIDGSSCATIVFPFTVIVNGTSIEITSKEGYDLVEDIIDEFENDTDSVAIQFPVDVTLADHTTVKVNTQDELEDLLEDCVEDGLDDDIECVDIAYPITFSIYSDATQQASTVTIENDNELYQFLDNIEETDIVSLNYPVVLILFTGETITVENNQELEATIELYEDSCDEDDDNDYDDDDLDDTDLINTLKQNIWIVSVYDSSGVDKTDLFSSYEINFLNGDILIASDGIEEIEGEWETDGNDVFLELSTEFDTDGNLSLLNNDWLVESFNNDMIEITTEDPEIAINVILRVK